MKTLSRVLLALLITNGLAILYATSVTKAVSTIAIGVYWDSVCTNPVAFVDWGQVSSGAMSNKDVFIRNEGDIYVTLTLATANWNPPEAVNFALLSWDYSGQVIDPSQTTPITLSLYGSPYIEKNTGQFSFDAVIIATGSISVSIRLTMIASVIPSQPPSVPEFPLGSAPYLAAIPLLFYLWLKRKKYVQ